MIDNITKTAVGQDHGFTVLEGKNAPMSVRLREANTHVVFTVITTVEPKRLGKTYTLDEESGTLEKHNDDHLMEGTAKVVVVPDLMGLKQVLEGLVSGKIS